MSASTTNDVEAQDVLQRALKLPPRVRKDIAIELFESAEPLEDSEEAKDAWRAELSRRVADIDSGKEKMYSIAETMAYLRQQLAESTR